MAMPKLQNKALVIDGITRLMLVLSVLHGLKWVYDAGLPAVFLNADRAGARWEAIQGHHEAWNAGQTSAFLAHFGVPGDYLIQGLLLVAVGKPGLFVQMALTSN